MKLALEIAPLVIFFVVNWVTNRTLHWHESTGKFEN